jgi:predicted enzyme related to lactoylglutathione lyase
LDSITTRGRRDEKDGSTNRIVHFEIHASNPDRAATFYRKVFGWDIQEFLIPGVDVATENRYWQVSTGSEPAASINGGLLVRRGAPPAVGQAVNAFVCTIAVASVDRRVELAMAEGGTLAHPRMPIRGVGWLAYLTDPDGNLFGVLQEDVNAA